MTQSQLEKAASFMAEQSYDTIDKTVLHLAKRAILDYLGCAVAGQREAVVGNLIALYGAKARQGESTAFGGKYSREDAAMINAVAGHALDFDDTSWTTIGHPTTVAAPVVFAEAERLKLSGRYVLAAYSIGVEVAHTFARMTMPEVSERGWHTTCVYGTIAAAAASAWIRRLSPEITVNALGIALSRAGGIRSNFGSMTKPLHAGLAVKAGMECADMAEAGVSASRNAFEAADGFADCFGASSRTQAASFGKPWDLATKGLAFKLYPCCSGAHPALDLLGDLMRQGAFKADDVESIHAGLSLLGPRELVNHQPKTPLEARFSLEYTISAMLLRGQLTLDELTPEAVAAPDIQAFMRRVSMAVDEDLAKLGFIGTAPVKLRITLKNGQIITAANDLARGNPEKPLTDQDFSEKFMRNATRFLPQKTTQQLLEALFALDEQQTVGDLIARACCHAPITR